MKVNDVVIAKPHTVLRCGSSVYTHAICLQVDPMVLVSEEGDMVWCKMMRYDVLALCEASPKAREKAFDRFQRWAKITQEEVDNLHRVWRDLDDMATRIMNSGGSAVDIRTEALAAKVAYLRAVAGREDL
jgi:hypothetical protein